MRAPAMVALTAFALLACAGGGRSSSSDAGTSETRDATADTARPLCIDGKSVDGSYPKVDYAVAMGGTPPDMTFETLDDGGAPSTVARHDFFEPCAPRSRLLLLRVTTGWCGTCRWDLAHTKELLSSPIGSRVRLVDLLVANDDNVPATRDDLAALRARTDAPTIVAIDREFRFAPSRLGPAPLPTYVLIDTRTMQILVAMDDPQPDELLQRVTDELTELDGNKSPPAGLPERVDGLSRKQWDLLRDMKLPGAPPPDPTNAKADDASAAALGKQLFEDTSLSPSGTVSCATCHDPKKCFADGRPQSLGVALGDRNAPSVLWSAHARWQLWDGRADTLWAQATGPFENPREFGSNRLFVAHGVFKNHRTAYETVFGALPPLDDTSRFPANGKPGDAAWTGMDPTDREAATRVFANVGKAIAAFERTLRAQPNALDRYISGETTALSAAQKVGLHTFFSAGCIQCHYGPRLTDDAFHVLRFPSGRGDGKPDGGRAGGTASLLASEFRADSRFSDAPTAARKLTGLTAGPWTVGAFRTPPIRGITSTGPYGHGGTTATLRDLVKLYSTAGLPAGDPSTTGSVEPWVAAFGQGHIDEVVSFLEVLTAPPN